MLKMLKRFFCYHLYTLNRWHWTHGVNGNDPLMIEREYKCAKCGKLHYDTIRSCDCDLKAFAARNWDKEDK